MPLPTQSCAPLAPFVSSLSPSPSVSSSSLEMVTRVTSVSSLRFRGWYGPCFTVYLPDTFSILILTGLVDCFAEVEGWRKSCGYSSLSLRGSVSWPGRVSKFSGLA